MKLLAASNPSAARTLTPGGSNPVTGSSSIAVIHFSRLKVTWESMLKPPQTRCLKNWRYSGEVDHDSRPCFKSDGHLLHKRRCNHRRYNAGDHNHRMLCLQPARQERFADLELASIVIQLPRFRYLRRETIPLFLQARKVDAHRRKGQRHIIVVEKQCEIGRDVVQVLVMRETDDQERAHCSLLQDGCHILESEPRAQIKPKGKRKRRIA